MSSHLHKLGPDFDNMAGYDCNGGFIIVLEGSYKIVATQLPLLPISPQILVLPALESYLETSEEPVSSPRTTVPSLCKAVQARRAAAVEFLRHSSALQRRYVFLHGGTAKTWSTAALHCHPEPREPAIPRYVRDEPMARAMRAADALDRQTASLQSIPAMDCPPDQCLTIPHIRESTDRLAPRATSALDESPSRCSATLKCPVSAISNLSPAPPSPVIVEVGKARLVHVPASRTGESPSTISLLSAFSVDLPTGKRCSTGNQVQSDKPLIILNRPEASRLRRHDSKLSIHSSSTGSATRCAVAAGNTTYLGGTRADTEDIFIHLADCKADTDVESILGGLEKCCSRSSEHQGLECDCLEGEQSSYSPQGNLLPTPAETSPFSHDGRLRRIHRIGQVDQQSALCVQNMIRQAINVHTPMPSAGRESLKSLESPASGPLWEPLFPQDPTTAIHIVAVGGEGSVSGAVLAATSEKIRQTSREVDNSSCPARLHLRYVKAYIWLNPPG
jgi:hypothetical protein